MRRDVKLHIIEIHFSWKIYFIGWLVGRVVGWMVGWLEKAEIKPTQPSLAGAWLSLAKTRASRTKGAKGIKFLQEVASFRLQVSYNE